MTGAQVGEAEEEEEKEMSLGDWLLRTVECMRCNTGSMSGRKTQSGREASIVVYVALDLVDRSGLVSR